MRKQFMGMILVLMALWLVAAEEKTENLLKNPSSENTKPRKEKKIHKNVLIASDFNTSTSLTCGIQDALDALPEAGGIVKVPIGTHIIQAPIRLRPNTSLIGFGRRSIIKKDPAFMVKLTQDIKKGVLYDSVAVENADKIRVGMEFMLYDDKEVAGFFRLMVYKIEGNRVFIKNRHPYSINTKIKPFKSPKDILVKRNACFVNAYYVITPPSQDGGNTISNLAIDGNRKQQTINGKDYYKKHQVLLGQLRNIAKIGSDVVISRCWIYDAGGINISLNLGKNVVIENCEIWGGLQGIHPGSGPFVKIVNNTIHHNSQAGIFLCMGNFGIIISGNQIYENGKGISGLGCNAHYIKHKARDGDHLIIISNNFISNNYYAGITTSQGLLGAHNIIISNNIIRNNNIAGPYFSYIHRLPGGIALYNAQNCIISGNRCIDDWDEYGCGPLVRQANAGDKTINIKRLVAVPIYSPIGTPPSNYQIRLRLNNGKQEEEVRGRRGKRLGEIILVKPLRFSYPVGTIPTIVKTQAWGIVLTGEKTFGNLVYGNNCANNMLGGILYYNKSGKIFGNIGSTIKIDKKLSFMRNLYPASRRIKLDIKGKYDDSCLHDGKKSIKIRDGERLRSQRIRLKANTRYRFGAWCKTDKITCKPIITLIEEAKPELRGNGKWCSSYFRKKLAIEKWIYYEGTFTTGPVASKRRVTVKVNKGSAWVEGIFVEEVKPLPLKFINFSFKHRESRFL